MRKKPGFTFIPSMRKVSSGHKLSIDTFYSAQCLFELRFYGPVNPMGSCRPRLVYLNTLLPGRFSPLSGWPVLCTFFSQKYSSHPANTQRRNSVVTTSLQRRDVVTTLLRCCVFAGRYFCLVDSEGSDQTARMRRLIWAFAVRICPKTRSCMARPMQYANIECPDLPTRSYTLFSASYQWPLQNMSRPIDLQ